MIWLSVLLQMADHVEVHFNSRDIESAVQAGAAAYTGVSVAFVSGGGDDDDDRYIVMYWKSWTKAQGGIFLKSSCLFEYCCLGVGGGGGG